MIRWIKQYLLSSRRDLKILVLLDVVFLLLMDLVFRRIPAPFPFIEKIGEVFVVGYIVYCFGYLHCLGSFICDERKKSRFVSTFG